MTRKGRNAGTIENYRDHMERLFEDWLDKPLARLGRQSNLVLERHDKITKESGPYIANGSMRSLRAIYNHAARVAYPEHSQSWLFPAESETGHLIEHDLTESLKGLNVPIPRQE
jgi:hypothetical protein